MLTKFDEQTQKAIVMSESIAFDLGHKNVGSEHLLLALLKMTDLKVTQCLNNYNMNEEVVYQDLIRLFGQDDEQPFYMEYSQEMREILQDAISLSQKKNLNKVTINILSLSLIESKKSVASELLKKYDVDLQDMIFQLSEAHDLVTGLDQIDSLINLNRKVKNQSYRIVGRDKELERLCHILLKKDKNNVLIIGEAGVGKTALVEKLAAAINNKEVFSDLQNKLIYELSLSHLVAGTKYRGEFEEKLKKVIQHIQDTENVIIFIDEIHNLIGAGGAEGAIDASNILKPYLARKEITVIGATTTNEYYQRFEHDQAMNRRFSTIVLKENTKEETLEILKKIKGYYQHYHHLSIPLASLNYLMKQVDLYIKDRTYPDKAIDILDLSCVKTKYDHHNKLTNKIIDEVISEYSSIDYCKKVNYAKVKKELKKQIIDQDQAIDQIIDHLQNPPPQTVILLQGDSGVGKSETVKVLAKLLNRHLIKIDMSTYQESFSTNKILGAPPGYLGYNQPSLLLTQLKTHPYSILLLDEIDKAHKDVQNLFMQVFEDGYLQDSQKRIISFHHVIIFMTCHLQKNLTALGFKKQNHVTSRSSLSLDFKNRISLIVNYQHLTKDNLKHILEKKYPDFTKQDEFLLTYDENLGARGIEKCIQYKP